MTPHGEEQLDLFGAPNRADGPRRRADRGRRGAVPAELWRQWLADPTVRSRFEARVHWREGACSYYLGSLGSSGHGKVRLGSHSDGTRHVVGAHVLAYQLTHGAVPDEAGDAVVAHTCDEPSCVLGSHLVLVDRLDNIDQYVDRRGSGPLADVRGARGRAVAIRDAILAARAVGGDVEAAIAAAAAAGLPPTGDALF